MDFEETFPLRLWINLGRREDRRHAVEAELEKAGIVAERFAAVDAACIPAGNVPVLDRPQPVRGYESAGRYALGLTQRLALREAARRKAPAVLLLEDDVVFHPNFRALIATVELPEDWGIFYLGCAHTRKPEWAGSRVVRVREAADTHAVAIRAPYFRRVMDLLDRHQKANPGVPAASDRFLALLHEEIPTYACFPNLAWQATSESDLIGEKYSNYSRDGWQKNWPAAVEALLEELVTESDAEPTVPLPAKAAPLRVVEPSPPAPKLALLFLTRGDVHHPEIWQEFIAAAPDQVKMFSHPKNPPAVVGGFLDGTAIAERHQTAWGDISLVRATRSLLLAALADSTLTHFVLLSESCVPVRPLPEMLRHLRLDPRSRFGFRTLKEASKRHAARISTTPQVPADCWRFQSQWWLMDRAAAVFSATLDFTSLFEGMLAADEAYFATVLSMQGFPLEGNVVKRDITWTSWEKDAGSPTAWPTLPNEKRRAILDSGAFFARKFPKGADIGRHGLHRYAHRAESA
jgi:GR25 family glycosyltransferase involved in LPS biosynthesis